MRDCTFFSNVLSSSMFIDTYNSKENQLKEKKRVEEAKAKAVRRV